MNVITVGMVPMTIVIVFYNTLGHSAFVTTICTVIMLVIFVGFEAFLMHMTSMKRLIIVKYVDIDHVN